MPILSSLPYPDGENSKMEALRRVFAEWQVRFSGKAADFGGISGDDLVFDGFYPHYFAQKRRILFIGWEPRQIAGINYLDLLYGAYHTGKNIGTQALADSLFHRRVLGIAYGLVEDMTPWSDLPEVDRIGDLVGVEGGFSFAFMNICKVSNEADSHRADMPVIDSFFRLSTESPNLYERQVAALEPHIVISMNLEGRNLEPFSDYEFLDAADGVSWSCLNTCGHRSLWIDAYHFSAWTKDDELDFYNPICNAIRKAGECTSHLSHT